MTNLGLWAPFIDEREMYSWYNLPASLRQECAAYQPDGHEMEPLSPSAYAALHKRTVSYVRRSVAPYRPAYHNDQVHFENVEKYGLNAADAYAAGNRRKMPDLVRQVFGLALRTHDAYHCASTFRADAPHGIYRPELGVNVATEWVTAAAVNHFMATAGLNLPARLFQTGVIWSSTYGGNTPTGQRLRIPNPQPRTIWGAIMRAADACPPPRFSDWLGQTCAVNYGEVPAQPVPRTLRGFVTHVQGFASYIEYCFNRLDTVAKSRITLQLGWRNRLVAVRHGIALIQGGNRQAVTLLRNEASKYGVTFTR